MSTYERTLFDCLERGKRYFFALDGLDFVGVFHEYLPDGTLQVSGQPSVFADRRPARTVAINPDKIIWVGEE